MKEIAIEVVINLIIIKVNISKNLFERNRIENKIVSKIRNGKYLEIMIRFVDKQRLSSSNCKYLIPFNLSMT